VHQWNSKSTTPHCGAFSLQHRTDTEIWTAGASGVARLKQSPADRGNILIDKNHGSWVARGIEYLGLQNFFFFNELGSERGWLGSCGGGCPLRRQTGTSAILTACCSLLNPLLSSFLIVHNSELVFSHVHKVPFSPSRRYPCRSSHRFVTVS